MNNTYKKNYLIVLVKLINLIDMKDGYTKMHSENVSKYAVMLGEYLNLDEKDIEILRMAGLLHDIGKIGIPDYILNKTDNLTDEEFKIIKRHPINGELLFPDNEYKEIKQIIRSHHEGIDGKGYLDGLKGDNIPYLAKIISVADTFDAMTTQRVYNKRKMLIEALEELYRVSRKKYYNDELSQQLDTELVNSFIKMVKQNKELLNEFNEKDSKILEERYKRKIKKL